ncbi:hypothetical protein BDF19DRAFT_450681, partial [Syncephalis fuscata]
MTKSYIIYAALVLLLTFSSTNASPVPLRNFFNPDNRYERQNQNSMMDDDPMYNSNFMNNNGNQFGSGSQRFGGGFNGGMGGGFNGGMGGGMGGGDFQDRIQALGIQNKGLHAVSIPGMEGLGLQNNNMGGMGGMDDMDDMYERDRMMGGGSGGLLNSMGNDRSSNFMNGMSDGSSSFGGDQASNKKMLKTPPSVLEPFTIQGPNGPITFGLPGVKSDPTTNMQSAGDDSSFGGSFGHSSEGGMDSRLGSDSNSFDRNSNFNSNFNGGFNGNFDDGLDHRNSFRGRGSAEDL